MSIELASGQHRDDCLGGHLKTGQWVCGRTRIWGGALRGCGPVRILYPVVLRQVGRPGEEIPLRDQEEFDALRANPEHLPRLLDLAHRGELPRPEW